MNINECFLHCNFLLYADDLKIYLGIRSLTDCLNVQSDLHRLSEYCIQNKLQLSLPKCNKITFTKKTNVINYTYELCNKPLSSVSVIRDLGVLLDSQLHLDVHIDKIVSNAFRMFGFIMRSSRDFKLPSTYIHLYNSLVRPHLEYASQVWNPLYNKYIENIERVQRKFIRSMHYKCFRKSLSHNILKSIYSLMSLQSRRVLLDVTLFYKICNNIVDCPSLNRHIVYCIPTRLQRSLNTHQLFYTNICKTNAGVRSPMRRITSTYNDSFSNIDILSLSYHGFRSLLIKNLSESS